MTDPKILTGDCRAVLPTLEPGSVQCCVTSPPYWGLRDYGTAQWEGGDPECDHRRVQDVVSRIASSTLGGGKKTVGEAEEGFRETCGHCGARRIDAQLGLEQTPEEYIANMVGVFREVWRVLRDDGTLWLNLGDSYASSGTSGKQEGIDEHARNREDGNRLNNGFKNSIRVSGRAPTPAGLKPKDLCMMPARVALALQADGWYLRSDIIWHKPNPMPESVTDRPTKAHEYIFLLTKAARYFYDADAIKEPVDAGNEGATLGFYNNRAKAMGRKVGVKNGNEGQPISEQPIRPDTRNKRSVWEIATQPYSDAHFATFPEQLPKICILAGSRPGGVVLDPFAGSGTVGQVALELGRRAILIELNPAYIELTQDRTFVTPGFF
jgi:DNA modification methylase